MNKQSYRPPLAHELQFNVAQLLKEPTGATRNYEVQATSLKQFDEDTVLLAPIVGEVRFLRTGTDILVTGTLSTTLQQTCGRCLTAFPNEVTIELEEEFYPTLDIVTGGVIAPPEEADEANAISERHILDLYEVVRQDFLLESGSNLYCKPDCRGLCPHCGQDRNLAPCDCDEEEIDLRWAGLRMLHLED